MRASLLNPCKSDSVDLAPRAGRHPLWIHNSWPNSCPAELGRRGSPSSGSQCADTRQTAAGSPPPSSQPLHFWYLESSGEATDLLTGGTREDVPLLGLARHSTPSVPPLPRRPLGSSWDSSCRTLGLLGQGGSCSQKPPLLEGGSSARHVPWVVQKVRTGGFSGQQAGCPPPGWGPPSPRAHGGLQSGPSIRSLDVPSVSPEAALPGSKGSLL